MWRAILALARRGEPITIERLRDEANLSDKDMLELSRRLDGFVPKDPAYLARSVGVLLRKHERLTLVEKLAENPFDDEVLERLARLPRGSAASRGMAIDDPPLEMPRPTWLVEGLVARGDILVLAGEPAAGKSLLAASLALSLAVGDANPLGAWLGPERPVRVLLVDEEQHPHKAAGRLLRLARGMGVKLDEVVGRTFWWTKPRQGFSFRSRDWVSRLHETLADIRPDLLVIDSLRAVRTGSEVDAAATRQFFHQHVYPLVATYGCAVMFLHHTRKMPPGEKRRLGVQDDIAGADIVGAVDAAMLLQVEQKEGRLPGEEEDQPVRKLSWAKLREGPTPPPLVLRLHGHRSPDGPLSLRLVPPAALALPSMASGARQRKDLAETILRLVAEPPPEVHADSKGRVSRRQIESYLDEDPAVIRATLDHLTATGQLLRRKDRPVYWLPPPEEE